MSNSKRQNPVLRSGGRTFTVRLKDARGRYTRLFSQARFYSILSDNKRLSQWRKFKPEEKSATEKKLIVLTRIEVYLTQNSRRHARQRITRTGSESRTRRRTQEVAGRNGRIGREASRRAAEIVYSPRKRTKRNKLNSNTEFTKKVKTLTRKLIEAKKDIPSALDEKIRNKPYEVRLDALNESGFLHISDVSTKGRKTALKAKLDKNGRVIKKRNGDPVMIASESPFDIAKQQGIDSQEHLWSIAKNYLAMHYDDLLQIGITEMQGLAMFGVVVTTNLPGWGEGPASIRYGGTISFVPVPKDFQAKKEAIESMTYQLVSALVRAINKAEGGEYTHGSVTSSGKSFQRLMEQHGTSGGRKWTKIQNFKFAFTLTSDGEEL
jgi:hypothetical protein